MRSNEVRKNAVGEPDEDDTESEDQLELEERIDDDGDYNADATKEDEKSK